MSGQTATNLDEHAAERTIRDATEATIRADIEAGQTPTAIAVGAGMVEGLAALGCDCAERPALLTACAKWAQERITAIRRELRPPPAAPTNQYPQTDAGLLAGARHVDFDLCECIGEPMIRLPGGEWELGSGRKCNARERLFYAIRCACVDPTGQPWKVRYRNDEYRLLVVACALNPLPVGVAFAGKVARVTGWAGEQYAGNFLYGEVAHAVGLVDRYVGGARIGKVNEAIIRAGLEAAGWAYGDVDMGSGRHGERWQCPRQSGVPLTGS